MSKYAKINSENIVENIIICEDSQVGLLSGKFVKVTDASREAEIGYEYRPDAESLFQKNFGLLGY